MDDILKDFEDLINEVKNTYEETGDDFLGDILDCVDNFKGGK
jgi:hypothetical protein